MNQKHLFICTWGVHEGDRGRLAEALEWAQRGPIGFDGSNPPVYYSSVPSRLELAGVGYIRAGSKAAWHSTHHTHGHVDSEGATVEMPLDHWETRAADKAMDPGVVAWVARVAGERDLRLPMVVDRCVIVGMVQSFVSLEGT